MQDEELVKNRKANLPLQIGVVAGLISLFLAHQEIMNFDYGFYASIFFVLIGAIIRQFLVSRD